jgi:glycosyltransferase involved in cell wall biosynthesis
MTDLSGFVEELNTIIKPQAEPAAMVVPESKQAYAEQQVVLEQPQSSGKNLKILIVSTHINQTNSNSKITYNIIKQLSAQPWLQIVHFATHKITEIDYKRVYPAGVKVIDATGLEKDKQMGFAFSELATTVLNEKPDIVFMLNDISVICSYIEAFRKTISIRKFKIWAYLDIVYTSPPQGIIDILNRDVEHIFCVTKTWKDVLKTQGVTRPIDVLTHGVDLNSIRSIPRDLARQTLGLPKDMFIFSSFNRNIPRKRLDLLIISFVNLIVNYPAKPIFLLMNCDAGDTGGFQIFEIFARELKLRNASLELYGNRLNLTKKNTGFRDDDINMLYNCADVGVSCSEGEGFGMCSFEQMAVGVPQIVPEINGYTEYCTADNSQLIKPFFRSYIPQSYHTVPGEAHIVDPAAITKAMERYLFDEPLRKQHGKSAKEKVSAYTWEKCTTNLLKRLQACREEDDD